jgi:hypothetical protein
MEHERRKEQRFAVPLEVRWESMSGRYAARTGDLSLSGCYIESLAQVSPGEEIRFEIQLPTGFWMPLHGTVVYHQPGLGFGVSFAGLTMMERNVLARVLNPVV